MINLDTGYLCDIEKLQFIPGSLEAMKLLQEHEYTIIIISNQSGLARGYFDFEQFKIFMDYYFLQLLNAGIQKPFFYYCPHHPYGIVKSFTKKCECRKPLPGMLFQAAAELKINLHRSFFIGDKLTDMEASKLLEYQIYFFYHKEKTDSLGINIKISNSLLSVAKMIISKYCQLMTR